MTVVETPTFSKLRPDCWTEDELGELVTWLAARAELLKSVREMKAGKAARVQRIAVSAIAEARARSGLSQQRFAELLGVSPRTLQEWEQGRRQPSGAARSLLVIAARRPGVLREEFAE